MKFKKRYAVTALLILLITTLIATNPTKNDYIQFSEEQIGVPIPKSVEIEQVNFYVFSTYTPIAYGESGMTHLGAFNNFFQISDGQFDYPWWLEFFK